jgi:hypothetical protein
MKTYEYFAVEVVQRPNGKPFYLLQAAASEILEWAAVPRKKSDFQVGYQRKLDDRHQGIREYLKQSEKNVVPSAILIAVNKSIDISEVNAGSEENRPTTTSIKK